MRLEPREDGQRRRAVPAVPGHHRRERHIRTEAPFGPALDREHIQTIRPAGDAHAATPSSLKTAYSA